jgi:hypothetical protein
MDPVRRAPELFELPTIREPRGNLAVLEGLDLPFAVGAVAWRYPAPGPARRDGHATVDAAELVVAVSGSFDAVLHDGFAESSFTLNRPNRVLYVPPRHWCELRNVSANAVVLLVSEGESDGSDAVASFEAFLGIVRP